MLSEVNLGLLILRLVVGLMVAGHGAQKLFGWFGGRGLAGHTAVLERLQVAPPRLWAAVSAAAEFFGGLGLAAGLLTPLAAAGVIGVMLVAITRVHWSKGFWNTGGGFEFPLALLTAAFVIGLTGPGVYSLDYALGIALPEPVTYVVVLVLMLIAVVLGTRLPTAAASHSGDRTR